MSRAIYINNGTDVIDRLKQEIGGCIREKEKPVGLNYVCAAVISGIDGMQFK